MTFSIFLLLASVYIRAALGSSLTVIDYDRQYVIWSDDDYSYTGYSSSFSLFDRDDCSDLSMIIYGIRKEYSKLDAGCLLDNGFKVSSLYITSDLSLPSLSAALSESARSISESSLSVSELSSLSESTPSISVSSLSSTLALLSEIPSYTNSR
ncbi:hypothetical protein PCH_Pc16g07160 [Penicillium rubens Wisconsin 54-1255]|uniref:Uncharacterized protein n=1 Tax=Penicillium rubens (strain ATCC 28089 / DSM 1075 / NRRL 1951 / Wisconsin 54-1255) TaxID=500485 RepID=B6H7D7_PENRW|nr:hypothetical protein PCH_Pc16g07160 [Penicillium rubens Wisconsin 54-1255]